VATKSVDERKELLARAVANEIRQGWRVESQTDYQAVIVIAATGCARIRPKRVWRAGIAGR
jgi:hypothetical protein